MGDKLKVVGWWLERRRNKASWRYGGYRRRETRNSMGRGIQGKMRCPVSYCGSPICLCVYVHITLNYCKVKYFLCLFTLAFSLWKQCYQLSKLMSAVNAKTLLFTLVCCAENNYQLLGLGMLWDARKMYTQGSLRQYLIHESGIQIKRVLLWYY